MKSKFLLLSVLCTSIIFSASAQSKETMPATKTDTVKTFCWYLKSADQPAVTGFLYRITHYQWSFPQPTQEQLNSSTLNLQKQYIPTSAPVYRLSIKDTTKIAVLQDFNTTPEQLKSFFK